MGMSRLSCFLWGHHVDNHVFKQSDGGGRRCRCGADYLAEDRSITRVRHTLVVLSRQARLREARRSRRLPRICLHPVRASSAIRRGARSVRGVADIQEEGALPLRALRSPRPPRGDSRRLEEYACFCGHSFLKNVEEAPPSHVDKIRHPADLRDFRPLHALPDKTWRLRRVRLHELWASVLFCVPGSR